MTLTEQIQSAKTQTEISNIVEKALADSGMFSDDWASMSYGEMADDIEKNAESMAEQSVANALRTAESRWFEVE